jgi:MFS family permease
MTFISKRLKNIIRYHLLQLDHPIPELNESEVAAEVERNYRWNFWVNLLDGVAFWIGLNFAPASTILPLFISKLTHNPLLIGLVAVIAQSFWNLPQLFVAGPTERLARKKPVVINLGFFLERLPFGFWPIAALIAPQFPALAVILLLTTYAWHALGAGVIAPAWQDMIAKCFPIDRRGRFFGLTTFLGTTVGAVSAICSSWFLKTYPFPRNFFYAFLLAALFILLSWIFLALTREPVHPVPLHHDSFDHFWPKMVKIIRNDQNFRRFLQARFLMATSGMGVGFVAVTAVRQWQIADSTVGYYTVALLIGQAVGNLLAGFLADRVGHKLPLEIGGAFMTVAFSLAWLAPTPIWYYPVFVCIGIANGIIFVSGIMITMEFSAPAQRPTYVGIANTIAGVGGCIAPLIGGWIAGLSYDMLFALSAGIGLISLGLMRWSVAEPRHENENQVNTTT